MTDYEATARGKLHAAIIAYYKAIEPDMYIDDWVLITHKDSVELTAEGRSMVGQVTPAGQPFHRTVGLLNIAANMVEFE